MNRIRIVLLMMVAVIFVNFSGRPAFAQDPNIPSTTKVLTNAVLFNPPTSRQLQSESVSQIVISKQSLQEPINIGDILVIEPTRGAPDGMLRKVVGIMPQDDRISFSTVQGTLGEAVGTGELHETIDLTQVPIEAVELGEGVTLDSPEQRAPFNSYRYNIDTGVGLSTEAKITGRIELIKPSFEVEADIKNLRVEKFKFTNTTKTFSEVKLSTSASISYISKRYRIVRYTFAPVRLFIGIIPVYIRPYLEVFVGLDGQVSVGVSTTTEEMTLTMGFNYEKKQFNPIFDFSKNSQSLTPTFSGYTTVKALVGPKLTFKIYNIDGPHVAFDIYQKLVAGFNLTPRWAIYRGLSLKAGVDVDFKEIIGIDWKPGWEVSRDYEWLIKQANLALGKKATASSYEAAGVEPYKAFDGNWNTRWASRHQDPGWIYVDLGANYNFNQVKLYWERAYGKRYGILVWDSYYRVWRAVYSTSQGDGGLDDIRLNRTVNGRWVAMLGEKRGTGWGYSLWEFEIHFDPQQRSREALSTADDSQNPSFEIPADLDPQLIAEFNKINPEEITIPALDPGRFVFLPVIRR